MKKLISLSSLFLLLMLLGATSTTYAGKVYKWVDSEGNVHYGERPPTGQGEQMRVPRSSPYQPAPTPSSSNKMDATNKLLDSIESERKEKQQAEQKATAEKEAKAKNCSKAKSYAASLRQGGRRFEVDEQGNRNYLDEAEIQKRLNEAEAMVKKWCN